MPFQQLIVPEVIKLKSDGSSGQFTVGYSSDDPTLGSFTASMHFASSDLAIVEISDIFSDNLVLPNPDDPNFPGGARTPIGDPDNDPNTDLLFLTSWSDSGQGWPGSVPVNLYTMTLQAAEGADLTDFSSTINFTSTGAQGFELNTPLSATVVLNKIPVFADSTFTINENTGNDTVVGALSLTDADDNLSSLNVSIVNGNTVEGRTGNAFRVVFDETNQVWNLVVNRQGFLNFEENPQFNLTIRATDSVGESDDSTVTVTLNDVNEAPTVGDSTFTIDENSANGTLVGVLSISDPDNDTLTITENSDAFDVQLDNGQYKVIVADSSLLDFETTPTFTFTVTATDPDGLSDQGTITINLNDLGENTAPVFDPVNYEKLLRSGLPNGSEVIKVLATDAENDTITYTITDGNTDSDNDGNLPFAIDANGVITVNDSGDLTNGTQFNLTVNANDGELNSEIDAAVKLNVTDQVQTLTLDPNPGTESLEPLRIKSDGTLTFTVKYDSTDPTVGSFTSNLHFGSETLEFVSITDIFSQNLVLPNPNDPNFPGGPRTPSGDPDNDPDTDRLFLTSWSDSTQNWPGSVPINLYTISFKVPEAKDLNSLVAPINFTATGANGFAVEVPTGLELTVNKVPVVTGNTFSIVENSANGTVLDGVLSITDADDALSTLKITDSSDAFDVKLDNGQFKLVVADSSLLNFETTKEFTFTVTATDPIGESSTGEVTVTLSNDPNDDNTPPVINNATFSIKENLANNTVVGTLNVSDVEDAIGNLNLSIIGGNADLDGDGQGAFKVSFLDGAWKILVNDSGDLNYEQIKSFNLNVRATDTFGASTNANVLINLQDVEIEIIDNTNVADFILKNLTLEAGESLFTDVTSNAAFNNSLAFYRIDDLNGTIKVGDQEFKPGDAGYLAQALSRIEHPDNLIKGKSDLSGDPVAAEGKFDPLFTNNTGSTAYYAPILLANAGGLENLNDFLELNSPNTVSNQSDIAAYFVFEDANAKYKGEASSSRFAWDGNSLGVEDLHSGFSDNDFNDLIFNNLTVM